MNLTFISDTHSLHTRLPDIDAGDVLIHCGDFTGRGTLDDTLNFAEFMAAQPFTHKMVIVEFMHARRTGRLRRAVANPPARTTQNPRLRAYPRRLWNP